MRNRGWAAAGLGTLVLTLAACGTAASSTTPGSAYGSSSTGTMAAGSPSAMASSSASGMAGAAKTTALTVKKTSIGNVLANAKGDTLYYYSKDKPGSPSTCTGTCLTEWPVLAGKPTAPMGVTLAGKLSTVTDMSGAVQATYNGYPLYTYKADMAPGQTSGNGVGGVWHVITGTNLTKSMSSTSGSSGMSGSSGSSGSGSTSTSGGGGYGY